MNQVTNKVPYGLLSEEERAQFCVEAKKRGLYKLYDNSGWSIAMKDTFLAPTKPYRLIIKDDEWYTLIKKGNPHGDSQDDEVHTMKGTHSIGDIKGYIIEDWDIFRPATAEEIQAAKPKVESLEDRVKAEYGDYEVVMLEEEGGVLRINRTINEREIDYPHVYAQSMRGFYRYVYQHEDGHVFEYLNPIYLRSSTDKILTPIAVLFTKGQ